MASRRVAAAAAQTIRRRSMATVTHFFLSSRRWQVWRVACGV